jgi:hypothetical protein
VAAAGRWRFTCGTLPPAAQFCLPACLPRHPLVQVWRHHPSDPRGAAGGHAVHGVQRLLLQVGGWVGGWAPGGGPSVPGAKAWVALGCLPIQIQQCRCASSAQQTACALKPQQHMPQLHPRPRPLPHPQAVSSSTSWVTCCTAPRAPRGRPTCCATSWKTSRPG